MNRTLAPLSEGFNRQLGILQAAVKQQLAYRFDVFFSILGSLLTMALLYYLWDAIYHSSTTIQMPYPTLITYVCLGQAFSFARPGQRRIFRQIETGIRSGNVLLDLVRPTDYQLLTFSDTLGAYLMEILMVSLPSYLAAILIFRIDLPVSPEAAIGFVLSLAGAVLLIFSLDFLIGLLSFWTISVWGIGYAKIAILDILAGTIIPLTLFPDWLRGIALFLPFKDIAYTPLAIYTGQIVGAAIWNSLLVQLAWGIGLILLTRLVWLKARRRIELQGG
jgi:ABC-2 type transport system permease protein